MVIDISLRSNLRSIVDYSKKKLKSMFYNIISICSTYILWAIIYIHRPYIMSKLFKSIKICFLTIHVKMYNILVYTYSIIYLIFYLYVSRSRVLRIYINYIVIMYSINSGRIIFNLLV